jgi:hypothetical protein
MLKSSDYGPILALMREVSQARIYSVWLRYSASALIVGGGTVALTLLLAGTVLQEQVDLVLQGLYTSLIVIGVALRYLSIPKSQRSYSLLDNRTLPMTVGIGAYIGLILSARSTAKEWPVMPYTAPWWLFFSVSLIAASLAVAKRIWAEDQYERLTELRAQLIDLEQKARIKRRRVSGTERRTRVRPDNAKLPQRRRSSAANHDIVALGSGATAKRHRRRTRPAGG